MGMRHRGLLTTALLSFAAASAANAPHATAIFVHFDRVANKEVAIDSAYLGEEDVCFDVEDKFTPDGDHAYQITIYDGGGREVYQSRSTVTARGAWWGYRTCYRLNDERDLAGTWWYVAELDDEPLVSESLKVEAAR